MQICWISEFQVQCLEKYVPQDVLIHLCTHTPMHLHTNTYMYTCIIHTHTTRSFIRFGSASLSTLPCKASSQPPCHSIFHLPLVIFSACVYRFFTIIKWHKGAMARICFIALKKKCYSPPANVTWQTPSHWNVLDLLLSTAKTEQSHHTLMTSQIYSQNWWSSDPE